MQIVPWEGYVRPEPADDLEPYVPPAERRCGRILFVGVRGSGEEPSGNPPVFSGPEDGLGPTVQAIYDGMMEHLINDNLVRVRGLQYRAAGTEVIPRLIGNNFFEFQDYIDSIYEGVSQLQDLIYDEVSACPDQDLVLAGYSQGALVVHIALLNVAASAPQIVAQIDGVALVADPAKVPNGAETTWEDVEWRYLGTGVANADGIWNKISPADTGPLPASVVDSTLAVCHNNDIVCAPGFGSSAEQHTNYSTAEMNTMGEWLAAELEGRIFF